MHTLNYSWVSDHSFLHLCVAYSQLVKWCSLCRDFAIVLVLCAGCRVGICAANEHSPTACLAWSLEIQNPDFVYYCPYCAAKANEPCAVSAEHS